MRTPARTFRRARQLRWAVTQPEKMLWALLRGNHLGLRFRRQHPIGPFVLDFYCPSVRLCVEVDGPSHDEPEQIERDEKRTRWLADQGIRMLRFSTDDVERRPAAVVAAIERGAAPSVASGATSPVLRTGEES